MIGKVQQANVGVLDILNQEHHRVLGRQPLEEQPPAGEQLLPGQWGPGVRRECDTQQPPQPHPRVRPLVRIWDEPVQALCQPGRGDIGGILLGDAQPLPDDLGQRPERHPLAV
jgi:hypothetical protein